MSNNAWSVRKLNLAWFLFGALAGCGITLLFGILHDISTFNHPVPTLKDKLRLQEKLEAAFPGRFHVIKIAFVDRDMPGLVGEISAQGDAGKPAFDGKLEVGCIATGYDAFQFVERDDQLFCVWSTSCSGTDLLISHRQ
jgi:hypothetical protein